MTSLNEQNHIKTIYNVEIINHGPCESQSDLVTAVAHALHWGDIIGGGHCSEITRNAQDKVLYNHNILFCDS